MDNYEDNNNVEEHSDSFERSEGDNINENIDIAAAPYEFNSNLENLNTGDDINNNNEIHELDIMIPSNNHDIINNSEDGHEQEEQLNNQDLEIENNLNEEEQNNEQEDINDIDDINKNEMDLNQDKDMNYMNMMDNNFQGGEINNDNEIYDYGNLDEENEENDDNNTNLENMLLQQNKDMINNNDLNNMDMKGLNNYNNNIESPESQNELNPMMNNDNYENLNVLNNLNEENNINNNQNINDLNEINVENLQNNLNNMDEIDYQNVNINPENIGPNMDLNQGFDAGNDQEDDDGYLNQKMDDNMAYDNNAINQQMLLQYVNEINQKFSQLERDFKYVEKQNQQLRNKLKYEQQKNKDLKPNDIMVYENYINQGKVLLNDIKKKNSELKSHIKELEKQKNTLDYKLIEANQRIKRLELDFNVNNKEENKSENKDNSKNENNELIQLKNKLDEFEISNSKLTLDNTNLKKKIEKMEQEHNEQSKLIINYKNSELSTYKNIIIHYKQYFQNHNIDPKLNISKEENNKKNNNLDYEKLTLEIANKDKIIKSLNTKLDKFVSDYKNIIDEKQLSQQKYNQLLLYNQKILSEKNDLIKKNENLKMEISDLNQKFEMLKTKYNNKKYIYENNTIKMQAKLSEYRQNVITLKLKINEMLGYNPKALLMNQKNNNNLINNPKTNSFVNVKQIPLTPTQKKKIPGIGTGNMKLNKMSEKGSKFGGNQYFKNNIKKNEDNNF